MGMQGTAGQIVDESQFTGHRGHGGFVAGSHHFQAPHIIGIARSILEQQMYRHERHYALSTVNVEVLRKICLMKLNV